MLGDERQDADARVYGEDPQDSSRREEVRGCVYRWDEEEEEDQLGEGKQNERRPLYNYLKVTTVSYKVS